MFSNKIDFRVSCFSNHKYSKEYVMPKIKRFTMANSVIDILLEAKELTTLNPITIKR